MDESTTIMLSYASVVKNSLCKTSTISNTAEPKYSSKISDSISWYEQTEKYEDDVMSRSSSLCTILSNDTNTNSIQSHVNCFKISHSLDSGQVSDMSSDNETCPKHSNKGDSIDLEQTIQMQKYQRRESVDSCQTVSSTCCSNPHCSSNHENLMLMCQRWQEIRKEKPIETDETVLSRRQKQIDYGKNTLGYDLYKEQIPIEKRTKDDPKTPNKYEKYSRRAFDGLIKIWRKQLHEYDPTGAKCSNDEQQIDNKEMTDLNED